MSAGAIHGGAGRKARSGSALGASPARSAESRVTIRYVRVHGTIRRARPFHSNQRFGAGLIVRAEGSVEDIDRGAAAQSVAATSSACPDPPAVHGGRSDLSGRGGGQV